jgi:hypothetical protein
MNIPFFGSYGTKYGSASATNPGITSPGNVGTFVSETVEDAAADVTGINNEYGEETEFANSCGIIGQRESAGIVEAIGPQVQVTKGDVSVIYQGIKLPLLGVILIENWMNSEEAKSKDKPTLSEALQA